MAASKSPRSTSGPALGVLATIMLAGAGLVLIAMIVLAYGQWRTYALVRAEALHGQAVQNTVENLLGALLNAESGQRGFVLTGEERYLEPYTRAIRHIPSELARLNALLTPAEGAPDPNLASLNAAVNRKLSELVQTIDIRRHQGLQAATELVLTDQGMRSMDEIRRLCQVIRQHIAAVRSVLQVRSLSAARRALLVTVGGSVILAIVLLAAYLMIARRTRDREEALARLRSLHELGLRLMGQTDLRSLLSEILRVAQSITGADMGNIQLLDSQGLLRIEAQQGFSREFLDFFNGVQEHQAACGTAMARAERIIVEDVAHSPIFAGTPSLAIMLAAGVHAVQSTPLISSTGALLGMLSTHYRRPYRPNAIDLRSLDLLTRQAAELIEKLRAEQALRESEERYRTTFDTAAVGIAAVGLDGRWMRFNDAVCAITGYSREELSTKTFADVTHPDDIDADWALARRVAAGEIPTYSMEKRYLRKDGSVVWVHLAVSLLRDPPGAPLQFVSVIEDISARKRVEAANRLLAAIVESSDDAVVSKDLNGIVTSWNQGAERMFGYSSAEMAGQPIALLAPPGRRNEMPVILDRIRRGERINHYETVRQTKDGKLIDVALTISPVRDPAGRIIGASKIARDITRRKRVERELGASEERYRVVTETAADAIFTLAEDGAILLANPAAEKIFGYAPSELVGQPLTMLMPERLQPGYKSALEKYVATGVQGTSWDGAVLVGVHRDGHEIPLEISFGQYVRDGKRVFTAIVRDVTERYRAEEQLRAAQHQLVSITDNMAAAVTRCSRDFRYVWVSRGYAAWLRRPAEDIAGRAILDVVGTQGYQVIQPYMQRVLTGERVEYTAKVTFVGPGERWIHAVYVPTYSHDQVDGWIAVVTDITDMVESQEQLREVNANLARANQDLERFAFAASHDLQEPLRMITAYSELLIRNYPLSKGDAARFVSHIVAGTGRMRQLLADILAYTEMGLRAERTVEPVDLNVTLAQVKQNLHMAIEETGAVVTAGQLPTVSAQPVHIASLLQNLLGNAIKYRGVEPPRIHISADELDGEFHFSVADNGIGIDPRYHDQIFEVFKRLHGGDIPGTGVGLAICKRVVERYGGRIWVESRDGAGATFFFTLPAG